MILNCHIFLFKVKPQNTRIIDTVSIFAITTLALLISSVNTSLGAIDVPSKPANDVIKTVCASGCNYSTINAAVKASSPGWTIEVKNGTYKESLNINKSGTQTNPIALVNYPGHSPVIDPGGGSYPSQASKRVEVNASWIIIDGFEIKHGWEGIKLYKPHVTIRNNYIHHNKFHGIFVISASDLLIKNNKIAYNGAENTCNNPGSFGYSPRHCHAIYVSDYFCTGVSNITITGNTLANQPGRGIQWNGNNGCGVSTGFTNQLVENNLFVNNSVHLMLFYGVKDSVFRNNTFVATSYPSTDDTEHTNIEMWGKTTNNTFTNNTFYSTRTDYRAINSKTTSTSGTTFDYNLWKVSTNSWVWNNSARSDFKTKYQDVTGMDANGKCCEVDPGFVDVSKGAYGITANSTARNRGTNSECPKYDKDGFPRPQESICDIGMIEFVP